MIGGMIPPFPYRTVPCDPADVMTVDPEGEDQRCVCGSRSFIDSWAVADATGRITIEAQASTDPDEYVVCHGCARIYRNRDLFEAGPANGYAAPCVGRYDETDPAFVADAQTFSLAAYGGPA